MHKNKTGQWDDVIRDAVQSGIKSFIAQRHDYGQNVVIPYEILESNFSYQLDEIHDIYFDIVRQNVLRLMYSVYVSDSEDKTINIPKTWFDYVKHGLKMRWPNALKSLKIAYNEQKTITRTLFPKASITSPLKKFYSYDLTSGGDERQDRLI